ncbi:matrix metalloproteinase-15 [Gadus macrocephalus]|uniref:matrix metalloproteinase-15 n=1 Tax=Gadus macrocephalus TaxID=80720 RepID=UPI0028CB4195|nr:matrix metalloproteinase-15 [Gadus macrocephalus]
MWAPRPRRACPETLKQTLRALVLLLCLLVVSSSEDQEGINAESWLRQFGYLSQASRQMSTLHSSQVLAKAIADMQRFYGLQVTGIMDPATVRAMRQPRCGLPDRTPDEVHPGSRRRRYTLTGQQWDKDDLTYSLLKQNIPASLGAGRTATALRRAFDVWSQATPLTFQEVPADDNNIHNNNNNGGGVSGNGSASAPLADILLLFASGFHGDMSLFDGEGGSLAHAYYPGPGMGGDTHFDADEPWTLDHEDPTGIDLFLVAVHELGHALGLEHSDHPDAVMAPFYTWTPTHNFTLSPDDRSAIQYIYGPPRATNAPPTSAPVPPPDGEPDRPASVPPPPPAAEPTVPPPRDPPPPPPRAPTRRPPAGPTTRGPDLRPPAPPRPTVPEVQPQPVTPAMAPEDPRLPPQPPPERPRTPKRPDHLAPDICEGDFDSVTVLRGEMFVFKGRWFWRVRRNRVLDNYPMPISVFWNGLPDDIDAAYERHDGKFVFFKGEQYWVFREADVLPGYPQPLRSYGRGLPEDRIDTVIWWEPNEHTYFFKGDRYWRYHEETRQTDKDFPKALSRWGKIPSSPRGVFLSDDGAHTYFYKGSSYWRFDNRKGAADPGYPRSVLRDFMGCRNAPDPPPETETERTQPAAPPPPPPPPGVDPRSPTRRDRDRDATDVPGRGGAGDGGQEEEEEVVVENEVVVMVPEDGSKVMTLVMVVVPLVLVVCILVLVYAILRSLQKKETPRVLVHCKRSLQDWV